MREDLRTDLWMGALIGMLLTVPLVAISSLGWTLFDFPFPPFDLFDGLTRALPGPVATMAIDTMVSVIGVLHLNTAETAKFAEQSMAIALVCATGTLGGALLFAALQKSGEPPALLGAILGSGLGGFVVLMEGQLNRLTTPGALVSGTWVFATFLGWGVAFGSICDHLRVSRMADGRSPDPSSSRIDRRLVLGWLGRAAAAVTGLGVAGGALFGGRRQRLEGERWSAGHRLPNANASFAPPPGTRPEFTPIERHYRIDIVTRPPAINGERWRLKIGGLVDQAGELALEEIRRFEPLHQFVTLSCISNTVGGDLIGTTRWTGVSLQRLLPRLRPAAAATHLKVTSADGFAEIVEMATISADERVMLAYAWDGLPLPIEHGFPLRLYVPDRYGMKQPKWIQTIDVLDHWEAGYWVQRGWDREGRMQSTAVIDAITADATRTTVDGRRLTLIGGIAHAGTRGISKVELQIDGGAWRPAIVREPLSETAWVVWRAEMELEAGVHTVAVRCYERDGTVQTSTTHSKRVRI